MQGRPASLKGTLPSVISNATGVVLPCKRRSDPQSTPIAHKAADTWFCNIAQLATNPRPRNSFRLSPDGPNHITSVIPMNIKPAPLSRITPPAPQHPHAPPLLYPSPSALPRHVLRPFPRPLPILAAPHPPNHHQPDTTPHPGPRQCPVNRIVGQCTQKPRTPTGTQTRQRAHPSLSPRRQSGGEELRSVRSIEATWKWRAGNLQEEPDASPPTKLSYHTKTPHYHNTKWHSPTARTSTSAAASRNLLNAQNHL